MQTATVYSAASSATEMHPENTRPPPNPLPDALRQAEYRHDHAKSSTAHASSCMDTVNHWEPGEHNLINHQHELNHDGMHKHTVIPHDCLHTVSKRPVQSNALPMAVTPYEHAQDTFGPATALNNQVEKSDMSRPMCTSQAVPLANDASKDTHAAHTSFQAMPPTRPGWGGSTHMMTGQAAKDPKALQPAVCRPEPSTRSETASDTHVPPTSVHAKPLPRLGCGGPSQLMTEKAEEESNALRLAVYRHEQPKRHAESSSTHVPPTRFHAMPLPRLGCGGPSQLNMDDSVKGKEDQTEAHESGVRVKDKGNEDHSPITVRSDTPTMSDTVQFQPVLKGSIQWKDFDETFWFAADIPASHLERVWELGTCCSYTDLKEQTAAWLSPMRVIHTEEEEDDIPRSCVQILMDNDLSILKVEPQVPLLQQQHITSLAQTLYDQFGQVPLDTSVDQLPMNARRQATLIHAVMAIRGGGQGTKMQQRAVQQNALASTLLDHGFNLTWTTKAVETIMDKFGLGKLQSVNSQPMGNAKIQAIFALCKDAGIAIPEPAKPKSGNDIPGSLTQRRKKRASDFKLNPADYTLVEGFFTKEDGSQMPQMSQLAPQSCGICLQTVSQAEVWVREGQKLSADELGLLVLGPIQVPAGLTSEEITFPCFNNDNQMVLITATLIQLGAKTIQHKQGDPKQVPSETCSLVAVTLYREDWQDDDWRLLPPREQHGSEKILLGPRPKPQPGQVGDPWHQGQDPWANYGASKPPIAMPAAAMPPQQGPTEKRFLEQDAKIATIQASLDELAQNQKLHAKQVDSQFKQAAQREQDNLNKMDQALKHIEMTVDNAMQKSMHQYQSSMDEKFQEIKSLFLNNKRPAPAEESEMED
ncbi:unnamed protein product [Cladocopium goreaui]|uniref:Uncharacterized protein n=1 Tax=Cladocopium goreaui TaxID=2562237 RepID=A0A9P1CMP2_9DINO|nr:unnamed protein product [Cladocopium goreaui]